MLSPASCLLILASLSLGHGLPSRGRHVLSSSEVRSASAESYKERLGLDAWSRGLRNPCRSIIVTVPGRLSPMNTTAQLEDLKAEMWALLTDLRAMRENMTYNECDVKPLRTLPAPLTFAADTNPEFTAEDLSTLYSQFHNLSAHFHVMSGDWSAAPSSSSCGSRRAPASVVAQAAGDASERFGRAMCFLLESSDSASAPTPSAELLLAHQAALGQELDHYSYCSGREMRDCQLMSHAIKTLESAVGRARAIHQRLEATAN